MHALSILHDHPGVGVVYTVLAIDDETQPGTGGAVTSVIPQALPQRATALIRAHDLFLTLTLNRAQNTAVLTLRNTKEPREVHSKVFQLAPGFQEALQVSLHV